MKLTALLGWYDEPTDWLAAHIDGLFRLGVDHLVAADGAYSTFPGGEPYSPAEQYDVIRAMTGAYDMGLTMIPGEIWNGEVPKRARLMQVGLETGCDWLTMLDTDEVFRYAPVDLKARLTETELDAAECHRFENGVEDSETRRCLFRAIPGMTVRGAHYCYVTPDGRDLWGRRREPALMIEDLVIDHRKFERPAERNARQDRHYRERNRRRMERFP